jgi:uncharacterized protein YbaR (Trm112 family)
VRAAEGCVRAAEGEGRSRSAADGSEMLSPMALDPLLLEILACPEDKGPLLYFEDEGTLYNPRLQRRYEVRDDIPNMLIDEAEAVDDAEHERLTAKAEAEGIEPTFTPEG